MARRTFELKQPKRLAAPTDHLPIPWLSLMLVCKIIANELRHHIYSAAGNTTYHLEVDNLQNQYAISHRVAWRRIPCPPSCVRTLHADLVFDLNTMFWASDGPMPVLTELYQVLNCFIHKGPLLPRRSPLDRHIHLDTLICMSCCFRASFVFDYVEHLVQVRVIDKRRMPNDVDESKKKQFRRDLEEESISRLVDQGVLFGAVDKIVCRDADANGDDVPTRWDVRRQHLTTGTMAVWNRNECNWGVPGSSSLEASGVLPRTSGI